MLAQFSERDYRYQNTVRNLWDGNGAILEIELDSFIQLFVEKTQAFGIVTTDTHQYIKAERWSFMKMGGHLALKSLIESDKAPEQIISKEAKVLSALQEFYYKESGLYKPDVEDRSDFNLCGINKLLSDYYEQHPESMRTAPIKA